MPDLAVSLQKRNGLFVIVVIVMIVIVIIGIFVIIVIVVIMFVIVIIVMFLKSSILQVRGISWQCSTGMSLLTRH